MTTTAQLLEAIRDLAPWHHDIEITDEISTGRVFSPDGRLPASQNQGVSLISPKENFRRLIHKTYPNGLAGKRFLDCACNAGGYCFWARELGASQAFGFDIREHWIRQAEWVREHRRVGPTDGVEFRVHDLSHLPQLGLEPFDVTFFSGIFYHLPDPIRGIKLAADLTQELFILNTALAPENHFPQGLVLNFEGTEELMSGKYELAWLPSNPETLEAILRWLGFSRWEVTMLRESPRSNRHRRIQMLAWR